MDVASYFRTQLKERDIARFNINQYTDVSFEFLEAILACHMSTCQAYIKGDVYVEFDDPAEICLPTPQGPLEALNQAAWAHQVVKKDGTVYRLLSDLDCMVIAVKRAEMAKNPKKADGMVHLVEMDIDLKTNTVTPSNRYGLSVYDELTLVRSENNNRIRAAGARKGDGDFFCFRNKFNHKTGEYGYKWVETKNKGKNPSLAQIVKGLQDQFMNGVNATLQSNKTPKDK